MLPALLAVLGLYLAACYGYGMYLLVRLARGRRVRQTMVGLPPRRIVHATARYEPGDLTDLAEQTAQADADAYEAQRLAA